MNGTANGIKAPQDQCNTPMNCCSEPPPPQAGHSGYVDQLLQLMNATRDIDIINIAHRDYLISRSYAIRSGGYTVITLHGLIILSELGLIRP